MKAFLYHLSFEFFTGVRNKNLLLMYYLLPLGFYLLMGVMMPGINPPFLLTMIPAMICFSILSGAFLGLPTPLVESREMGIFRSFKVNGIPVSSILIIPCITITLHLLMVSVIIFTTAPLFFSAPLPSSTPIFFFHLFIVIFSLSGLGILIGVVAPHSRATVLYSQLFYLPSMMIGGLMVPLALLPPTLKRISLILPATHAMALLQNNTLYNPSFIILLFGGCTAFYLSFRLFTWDRKNDPRAVLPAILALLPYLVAVILNL